MSHQVRCNQESTASLSVKQHATNEAINEAINVAINVATNAATNAAANEAKNQRALPCPEMQSAGNDRNAAHLEISELAQNPHSYRPSPAHRDRPSALKRTSFGLCFYLSMLLLLLSPMSQAWQVVNEAAPEPTREFRAAWVATVYNIDWPSRSGLSAQKQKSELIKILNEAARQRLNAIILQIRPNSDALYSSNIEPWSVWLSGAGVNPGYDPLAFAVAEGHRRGIEIHAWFNPFRATVGNKKSGRGHVSQRYPKLLKRAGSTTYLNPSSSTAQQHVIDVILDVVKRYDIDGVHLDDYFYPYPPHHKVADGLKPSERRAAIDDFIEELYDEVKSEKPWVRVGISPFGIWQPGYPSGVKAGVNAYEQLACDARKWLQEGWVDYLAPQLYWRCAGPQSYQALMKWWSSINPKRPIWPGIASGRINSKTDPGRPASEIGRQIDYSRSLARQSPGQIFWSWKSIGTNRGGLHKQLAARYNGCALPPAMPWSGSSYPSRPKVAAKDVKGGTSIVWKAADKRARKWLLQLRINGKWQNMCILPAGQNRLSLPSSWVKNADRIALWPIGAYGQSGRPSVLAR